MEQKSLLIACGALARELAQLKKQNNWEHLKITCLPAELHHRPNEIPGAVNEEISRYRREYDNIFIAYADCGTRGVLDQVIEKHGVERIGGAHCYEFFAGDDVFASLSEEEPGTFYLTDFLVRNFDKLVVESLGLNKHPELKDAYFGNYSRLVYLAQVRTDELAERARECADFLGLEYHEHVTGLEPVEQILQEQVVTWRS